MIIIMIGAIVLQSIRFIGKAVNKNNNQNFGSWLVFGSDGTLDLILPTQSSDRVPSNCYTIAIIGYNGVDEYVSNPFTIY